MSDIRGCWIDINAAAAPSLESPSAAETSRTQAPNSREGMEGTSTALADKQPSLDVVAIRIYATHPNHSSISLPPYP